MFRHAIFITSFIKLLNRSKVQVAELDGATLALKCDVTLGSVGCALVLQLAVDINGNLTTLTNDISLVPLADRLLIVAHAVLYGELAHALDI